MAALAPQTKTLHWTQRLALVRHNLHTASRSGDFTLFKSLQAHAFVYGTNHVATLSAALGDQADTLLSGLDDLNAGIAQVHEDAFKNVYESLKDHLVENPDFDREERRSKVHVDTTMQKQMADMAIDKMTNSAISLINQQAEHVQDTTASVWITGATIIADCVEICLKQMGRLEENMDDFIRIEESWTAVKASIGCATAALRGIYTLMDVCSTSSSEDAASRRGSFVSATGSAFRRLSNAFSQNAQISSWSSSSAHPSSADSRRASFAVAYRTPDSLRHSISSACPVSLPEKDYKDLFSHTDLSPIPPTPGIFGEDINPFDSHASPPVPRVPDMHVAPAVSA